MKTVRIHRSCSVRSLHLAEILFIFLIKPASVSAIMITGVAAPDLIRPKDGVVYPFTVTVTGTYHGKDINDQAVPAANGQYWDQDNFIFDIFNPDDPIDLTGPLAVPLPPVGAIAGVTVWTAPATFDCGCTTGGIVFGPSGNTGEGPVMDDGYFYFTSGSGLTLANLGSWGYNKVTCVNTPAVPTTVPAAPPYPPMKRIPEPTSLLHAAIALTFMGYWRRRS